jgi:fermentation-respiration switch protein FrsA (DUF1100 family)
MSTDSSRNAPGFATARSLNQIFTYDAYNVAEVFLKQPLQSVAGNAAGSKWMNDDLYRRAASTNKRFHGVEGANYVSLYEVPQYVDEAASVCEALSCPPGDTLRFEQEQAAQERPAPQDPSSLLRRAGKSEPGAPDRESQNPHPLKTEGCGTRQAR